MCVSRCVLTWFILSWAPIYWAKEYSNSFLEWSTFTTKVFEKRINFKYVMINIFNSWTDSLTPVICTRANNSIHIRVVTNITNEYFMWILLWTKKNQISQTIDISPPSVLWWFPAVTLAVFAIYQRSATLSQRRRCNSMSC